MSWQAKLDALLQSRFDTTVELRRYLHMHPEPSGAEDQTSLFLYQQLADRGLAVTMGPEGKGLFVDCDASRVGSDVPKMALRADIDALRINDRKDVPYRSHSPGIMHACGHDAHSAILFTVVTCLDELARDGALDWPIAWRGIFQPSEETATGARQMVAAGAMEDIDAIAALHVDPARQSGRIGLRVGTMTAACDAVRLTIRGRSGHAARPHLANDPIAAAAQLINSLYQFIPRRTDSLDAVVLAFGQIEGGQNPNVIPEEVTLRGTLRTLDRQVREKAIDDIRQIARGVEEIAAVTVDVALETSVGSVYNDPRLTELVSEQFETLYDASLCDEIIRPSMGSEDFACYLEHAAGVLMRLGSSIDPINAPGLHTPLFDIDEKALLIGARVLAHSVVTFCAPAD